MMTYERALAFAELQRRLAALERDAYAALDMARRLEDCNPIPSEREALGRVAHALVTVEGMASDACGLFVKMSSRADEAIAGGRR